MRKALLALAIVLGLFAVAPTPAEAARFGLAATLPCALDEAVTEIRYRRRHWRHRYRRHRSYARRHRRGGYQRGRRPPVFRPERGRGAEDARPAPSAGDTDGTAKPDPNRPRLF